VGGTSIMKKLLSILTIALLAVFFVNCGGDKAAFTTPQDQGAAAYFGLTGVSNALGSSSVDLDEVTTDSYSVSENCPESGNISISLDITSDTSGSINYNFNSCAFKDEEGANQICTPATGKTITIDGDLIFSITTDYSYNSGTIDLDGTLNYSGAIDGSCVFDMQITSSYSSGESYTGTICGKTYSELQAYMEVDDVCDLLNGTTSETSEYYN
jgi:hypothetical protein